jgi:flagellar protein FlaG
MANVQLSALLTNVSRAATQGVAPSLGSATAQTARQGNAAPPPPATVTPPPGAVQSIQPVQPSPATETGREALELATQRIREFLKSSPTALEFTIDENSGRALLRIIDPETKQLIRQIPSEEVLAISRALDRLEGLLLQQRA